MSDEWMPLKFIGQEIHAHYETPPLLTKKPDPPNEFVWAGKNYRVISVISRWADYHRRGRMARNMQPAHLETATARGSWGVGRFYFRVQVEGGRVFDLYYDRAPKCAGDRSGHWFLWREMEPSQGRGSGRDVPS
jgi:hypothetical protein